MTKQFGAAEKDATFTTIPAEAQQLMMNFVLSSGYMIVNQASRAWQTVQTLIIMLIIANIIISLNLFSIAEAS